MNQMRKPACAVAALLAATPVAAQDAFVLDEIVNLSPKHIAYISCDPATLARDTKRLISKGYELNEITPVDMFPQTYHIETISFWTAKN